MKNAALVIMAAGMASRYGGGKQIEGMGPHGEILLEYSVMDAIRAGFTKVVFIIKREMLDRLKALCGDRFAKQIEVFYAFQDFSSVPGQVPEARVKPFGTVHAVLCARPFIAEPFAVINADDYYGVESFAQMYDFLTHSAAPGRAAMMGYQLRNTVSRHGTVTRGLCQVEDGRLTGVREVKKVKLFDDGAIADVTDEALPRILSPDASVSMNFWGFDPSILDDMGEAFARFVGGIQSGDLTAEYLLPVYVDEQLRAGCLSVQVIPTAAIWFGVTYKEDKPAVAEALKTLHAQGLYVGSADSQ